MTAAIPPGAPIWADGLSSDLDRDVEFYRDVFGWEAEDAGEELFHYHTFSKDGRAVFGVAPTPPGEEPTSTWLVHFRVADCDEATERATGLGGTIAAEPTDVADMLRFSMVIDPHGAAFGLVEPKGDTGFESFGEENSVYWVEYGFDGVPAEAMRYYADLLGWDVVTPPWETGERPYAAVKASGADLEFGGCHAEDGGERPNQWVAMVRVADADTVCARAKALGGAVVAEPADMPGTRVAAIATPTGTTVGIGQPLPFS